MAIVAPLSKFFELALSAREYSKNSFYVDFDKKADVLYVSFVKPTAAADGEISKDGVITRRNVKGEILGFTVLNASRYLD